MQTSPMLGSIGPGVGAEEVLAVDGRGGVGEDGLDVALGGILPLLVRCGGLVDAAVRFVEFFGSGGAEYSRPYFSTRD